MEGEKPLHKFEKLEVWQLAIEYTDLCYALAEKLPRQEEITWVHNFDEQQFLSP